MSVWHTSEPLCASPFIWSSSLQSPQAESACLTNESLCALIPCILHCCEFESVAECAFEQEPIAGHTGILKVSQPVLLLKLTSGSMLPWQDQLGTVVQEALT